mmetsp:Transcript_57430/g.171316  ORF Transcript_57430/g.171316 Transcript_57430/m.171316 type:complete len:91 (-) Transcript_57430:638-910(-)
MSQRHSSNANNSTDPSVTVNNPRETSTSAVVAAVIRQVVTIPTIIHTSTEALLTVIMTQIAAVVHTIILSLAVEGALEAEAAITVNWTAA